ncbi:ribosome small subunit-dependent GTPase A [Ramlibacter algicola]|uniref:Small ribosomal subunit biogenesis GTPase RsgA n=1 Tax=Ramlibacter algicola TaxID=2795217 RepID=A0A934PWN6_9BURK|nr:ribosome small subunit-dependent GTPase A [Ramlibacter algicola]MBK0391864.1 ribosome small subunit-dependent GTPase A [Ramlibacter algicola]
MHIDFDSLRGIGLSQAIVSRLGAEGIPPGLRLARVTETQRDCLTLHDGHEDHLARPTHRLHAVLQARDAPPTVGDWVLAGPDDHGAWWVHERLDPVTQIARRANDGRRQQLASNVDTALLVMGLDLDFNPRRAERYIATVRAAGVAPVVVLTKADIAAHGAQRVDELRHRLPASVPVVAVDGTSDSARVALWSWLGEGQTLVLLGASGAGKSTLTNTLIGDDVQSTGGVRQGDGRGKHTTTARSLHFCTGGACIIDTPGLRTWRPDADAASLAATFDDVEALAGGCRFRDCRHDGEPGCAVRAAVAADRLSNYRKLLRDAQRGESTPLERIALRRKWKAIGKAGSERTREKRR